MKQLPLGVRLLERAVFDTFVTGSSALAVAAARAVAADGGGALLYLHGIEGAGKSHLLQAICAARPGAAYLPLGLLRGLGPEVLAGLAAQPLVAVDDPWAIAGEEAWERALFALYNDCVAAGASLVVAARVPAHALALHLPDLRSRLAAMPHYTLQPLDEAQQREALRARAAARGLALPEETLQYLQRRFARDMASLHALLDRLDAASLAEQRAVTVPFVRRVLGEPQEG